LQSISRPSDHDVTQGVTKAQRQPAARLD